MLKETDVIIGEKGISVLGPVFFLAEITRGCERGADEGLRLVDAAAECGADAVRVRTSRAGRQMLADTRQVEGCPHPELPSSDGVALRWEDVTRLKKHAEARGILFLPTPCDEVSCDFLDEMGTLAFYISSCDLTHLPLLRHVASKGKPVILATGMSYLGEVSEALLALKSAGAGSVVLMHSVSAHPVMPESLNLRAIATLQRHFDLPVGYTDHGDGILYALAAAILGAAAIAKPLTLIPESGTPAGQAAVGPIELRRLIESVRAVESSLGDGRKRPSPSEAETRLNNRRSIVAAVDIRAHESIAGWMLACERPGTGLEPRRLEKLIGMRARRDIPKGTPLQWDDLSIPSRLSLDLRPETAAVLIERPFSRTAGEKEQERGGIRQPGHSFRP